MKKWTALRLHQLATWIYSGEHLEHVEIEDEYGICRYSVDITVDEYAHKTDNTFAELPEDWTFHQWIDGQQWC
jgi:hypothetical protein